MRSFPTKCGFNSVARELWLLFSLVFLSCRPDSLTAGGLRSIVCPGVRCCDHVDSLTYYIRSQGRWKNKWQITGVSLESVSRPAALTASVSPVQCSCRWGNHSCVLELQIPCDCRVCTPSSILLCANLFKLCFLHCKLQILTYRTPWINTK